MGIGHALPRRIIGEQDAAAVDIARCFQHTTQDLRGAPPGLADTALVTLIGADGVVERLMDTRRTERAR
jgi:hypothetical protein